MHGQSRRSEGPARYSNCERTDNGDCDRERISLDRHFASKSYCGENNDADAWLLKWVASFSGPRSNDFIRQKQKRMRFEVLEHLRDAGM